MSRRVVINRCFGGFGISREAYEKLIEWGVPVLKYVEQKRGPDGRYLPEPANEGEVIFDHELTPLGDNSINDLYWKHQNGLDRYWETWLDHNREHPLLLRLVDEMGEAASGRHGQLVVVEIPDDVDYEIDEYDGAESIHEKHRSWS